MNLTNVQWKWLRWLAEHGNSARVVGGRLVCDDGSKTNNAASQPVLHLLVKGALHVSNGRVAISAYGRRLLTP